MQYRRSNITGATYFFTVNLANRKNTLFTDEFDKLRASINKVKKSHPFILDALVVLPEHLHACGLYLKVMVIFQNVGC